MTQQGEILLQQFDAVLDTIDYGVLFMGPDLRSKIINRKFRDIWNIPYEFIRDTRPTMADLINFNRHNQVYDVAGDRFRRLCRSPRLARAQRRGLRR